MSRMMSTLIILALTILAVPQAAEAQGNPRVTGDFVLVFEGPDFRRTEEIQLEALQLRDGRIVGTVQHTQTLRLGAIEFPPITWVGSVTELIFIGNRAFLKAVSEDGLSSRLYALADNGEGEDKSLDTGMIIFFGGTLSPPLSLFLPILNSILDANVFDLVDGNIQVNS